MALARSFGVVQIKPSFDPLKAQVHLDLHRLAPQVVAAQIVDVFANARTGQMRAVEPELRWAPPRPETEAPTVLPDPLCPKRREANRRSALTAARPGMMISALK
jgi:hypothetical protein